MSGIKKIKIERMKVSVLFFGILADIAGTGTKIYENIKSVDDLRIRISDDFPEIINYNFRISVNNEIIIGNQVLQNRDEVALLPPFAGG